MKPEDYIIEITRILHTLDTLQLVFVLAFLKEYLDIKGSEITSSDSIETGKA